MCTDAVAPVCERCEDDVRCMIRIVLIITWILGVQHTIGRLKRYIRGSSIWALAWLYLGVVMAICRWWHGSIWVLAWLYVGGDSVIFG